MTLTELQKKLQTMTDAQVSAFCDDFGGGQRSRDQIVREFVDDPKFERRIAQLLDLQTEDEKLIEATRTSAEAAALSAHTAKWATTISGFGVLISLLALIVSICTFAYSCSRK